eukprot:9613728-Lingulodinium_polyedra.AAC.1
MLQAGRARPACRRPPRGRGTAGHAGNMWMPRRSRPRSCRRGPRSRRGPSSSPRCPRSRARAPPRPGT